MASTYQYLCMYNRPLREKATVSIAWSSVMRGRSQHIRTVNIKSWHKYYRQLQDAIITTLHYYYSVHRHSCRFTNNDQVLQWYVTKPQCNTSQYATFFYKLDYSLISRGNKITIKTCEFNKDKNRLASWVIFTHRDLHIRQNQGHQTSPNSQQITKTSFNVAIFQHVMWY